MKKPLLLSLTALAVFGITTATTLYAQTTTGSSVIARMKAAAANFTLSELIPTGQTGLTSAPLVGKKTGDILTAGEYNRLLEMIVSAGGGISDVELITSQAASPSATADYSFRVSQANCPAWKKVISGGCSYPNTLNTFVHNTPTPDLTGWICGGLHHDGDVTNNTAKYPTRPTAYAICGTYGGSSTGSSGWVDVPLTGSDAFNQACEYRFYMNAMWFDGIYYVNAVAPTTLIYISHNSVVSSIPSNNKTSYQVNGSPYHTVSKIEKRCGGSGTWWTSSTWIGMPDYQSEWIDFGLSGGPTKKKFTHNLGTENYMIQMEGKGPGGDNNNCPTFIGAESSNSWLMNSSYWYYYDKNSTSVSVANYTNSLGRCSRYIRIKLWKYPDPTIAPASTVTNA